MIGALSLSLTAGGCFGSNFEGDWCTGPDCYGYDDVGEFDDGYYSTSTTSDEGYLDEGYYTSTSTTEPTTGVVTTDAVTTDAVTTDVVSTSETVSTSTTSGTTGTDTGTSDTGTSDTGTTGTGTGTETGTETGTSTETGGTDTGGSSGSGSSTGGGGEVNFPPPGSFGDDVQELDLVGTWSLQWAPDLTTWDSVLTIDNTGNFVWRETSADCKSDTMATGFLWVEPGQIVMHVDTWERQLPWDTLGIAGQEFPPPFRLRMTYALLGPNLALAGTDRIVEAQAYEGRAYLQTAPVGVYIAGQWYSEAELTAAFDGQKEAVVVVRDRWLPTLDIEPGVDPQSTGIVVHDQVYWGLDPPVATPVIFEGGNWTCLNGCPQPAGATLINGGNLYAYGPYAGYQRMMTFATGRSFRRDVDTDCQ